MKFSKLLVTLIFLFSTLFSFSQNAEEETKIIKEGIVLHDNGNYKAAIKKYDKVLKINNTNMIAWAEKAYSLMEAKKYNQAIECCQKAIEIAPKNEDISNLYTSYANVLDLVGKPRESLKIYEEAIDLYPQNYMLLFNKGITHSGLREDELAIECMQHSMVIYSGHAGTQNALARILYGKGKNVPSLMAFALFFVNEPQSARAKQNIPLIQSLISGNAHKDKKTNAINISLSSIPDSDEAKSENDFSMTTMILELQGALNLSEELSDQSDREKFLKSFNTFCNSLEETQEGNFGFYWEFYAPFFIEMNENNMTETFSHLVFSTTNEKEFKNWMKTNKPDVIKFYDWVKAYDWPLIEVE
ncbi:MAG: tetratricopeptide repeat protein [Salibacteraceae bacterium]